MSKGIYTDIYSRDMLLEVCKICKGHKHLLQTSSRHESYNLRLWFTVFEDRIAENGWSSNMTPHYGDTKVGYNDFIKQYRKYV